MKRVPVSGGRFHALVDDEDYEMVTSRGCWTRHSAGYAWRSVQLNNGRWSHEFMHRVILGLGPGGEDPRRLDHKNRDKLDNRRENLRIGLQPLNMQNVPSRGGGSEFRGVSWDRWRGGGWRARVMIGGQEVFHKRFATELGAALAAEAYRAKHMPFAQPDPALIAFRSRKM